MEAVGDRASPKIFLANSCKPWRKETTPIYSDLAYNVVYRALAPILGREEKFYHIFVQTSDEHSNSLFTAKLHFKLNK